MTDIPTIPISPKLRIRGLKKAFGSQQVLAGVDLDIAPGENLVLLGASGSGKTVLLRCIVGLTQPDAGSILIDGHEMVGLSAAEREPWTRKIGVLFQNGALFDSLPVWQNIVFDGTNAGGRGLDRQARDAAISKLAQVGLGADVADLLPAELSGGMKKRVALGRAIFHDPEILFLDAPTDGLDPILTTMVDKLIQNVLARLRATAMTITLDVASAERLADRIALLSAGRIAWEGATAEAWRSGNALLSEYLQKGGWDDAETGAGHLLSSSPL